MQFQFLSRPLRTLAVAAALLTLGRAAPTAEASLVFNFTEAGDGGVVVTATGSGFTTGGESSDEWNFLDYTTPFLNLPAGPDILADVVISGSLSNSTQGTTQSIIAFYVQKDGGPDEDDVGFRTADDIEFDAGDMFDLSLDATFSVGTLAFNSLIPGTHTEPGGGSDFEIFGPTTVNVPGAATPEPASLSMMGLGALALAGRRYRRRRAS